LPEGGPYKIEAVSMDLGPAFAKSVRKHAPQAVLCFDPLCGIPHNGSYVQGRIMSGVVPDTWRRAEVGPLRTA